MTSLAVVISLLTNAYIWIIIISILLSYFMDPYHPVRRGVDNLVRPLLDPIRRVLPPLGMFDFSPIVLILLIQFLSRLIVGILISI